MSLLNSLIEVNCFVPFNKTIKSVFEKAKI